MDLFEFAESRRSIAPAAVEPRPMPEIRNADGKRARMLQRLKAGPLTTFEAERIVHRGQATIGQLRGEGHVIELVDKGDRQLYVYREYRPKVRLTKSDQDAYYATPHWRAIAYERKEIDGFACVQCGSTEELATHHWQYNLFDEDVMHDLITFCSECHSRTHQAISGSGVHFPRSAYQHIQERIWEETCPIA